MSENNQNVISSIKAEDLEKIKNSLLNIEKKENKIIFCLPDSETPSASVYEIFFQATVLKKNGYKVFFLVEDDDYKIPTWVDEELTKHEYVALSKPKITVSPEDILVIPEVFSHVMEQTKNLPCLRIGLLQSVDYMLNSLLPGIDWTFFGIRDIITTSQTLKNLIDFYYNNKFNVLYYNIGIPEYFNSTELPKKPVVSVVSRNPNDITKFIKLFYSKYPQYSWINFDPMLTKSKPPKKMRRVDFANRLKENFAAVWIDRISSFGTFPLECMKSGVIPICLVPDIIPDYLVIRDENNNNVGINNNAGVWTNDFYELPTLLEKVIVKFLDDTLPKEIYDEMYKVSSKYTQENAEKMIINIYQQYINQRYKLFSDIINNNNNNNNN